MLAKTEGKRRGWQRMRWLYSIIDSTDMNLSKLRETVKDKESLVCCSPWVAKSWPRLSNWTATTIKAFTNFCIFRIKVLSNLRSQTHTDVGKPFKWRNWKFHTSYALLLSQSGLQERAFLWGHCEWEINKWVLRSGTPNLCGQPMSPRTPPPLRSAFTDQKHRD